MKTLILTVLLALSATALADSWTFYQDAQGEWRWRRQALNNEIVAASSEGFGRIRDAVYNAEISGFVIDPEATPAPTPSKTQSLHERRSRVSRTKDNYILRRLLHSGRR